MDSERAANGAISRRALGLEAKSAAKPDLQDDSAIAFADDVSAELTRLALGHTHFAAKGVADPSFQDNTEARGPYPLERDDRHHGVAVRGELGSHVPNSGTEDEGGPRLDRIADASREQPSG